MFISIKLIVIKIMTFCHFEANCKEYVLSLANFPLHSVVLGVNKVVSLARQLMESLSLLSPNIITVEY